MPTSAQSAVSASARLSVDSDCDREPARDNVIPPDVNDHGSTPTIGLRLHRDSGGVDRDELTFDHCFRLPAAVPDVDTLAVEALVFLMRAEWTFGARRRDLELVRAVDQPGSFDQRSSDPAHALAVFDGDRFAVIDGDAQRAPRLP